MAALLYVSQFLLSESSCKFLAHSNHCAQKACAQRSFYTQKLLHTRRSFCTQYAFRHGSFDTQKALTPRSFVYTEEALTHSKLLQTDSYLQTESVCTQPAFTRSRPDTQQAFTRSFTQRNCPHELPFIAGCSQITRKKHSVSCPAILPNTSPMHHSCSHHHAFCATSPSHHFSKSPLL